MLFISDKQPDLEVTEIEELEEENDRSIYHGKEDKDVNARQVPCAPPKKAKGPKEQKKPSYFYVPVTDLDQTNNDLLSGKRIRKAKTYSDYELEAS